MSEDRKHETIETLLSVWDGHEFDNGDVMRDAVRALISGAYDIAKIDGMIYQAGVIEAKARSLQGSYSVRVLAYRNADGGTMKDGWYIYTAKPKRVRVTDGAVYDHEDATSVRPYPLKDCLRDGTLTPVDVERERLTEKGRAVLAAADEAIEKDKRKAAEANADAA